MQQPFHTLKEFNCARLCCLKNSEGLCVPATVWLTPCMSHAAMNIWYNHGACVQAQRLMTHVRPICCNPSLDSLACSHVALDNLALMQLLLCMGTGPPLNVKLSPQATHAACSDCSCMPVITNIKSGCLTPASLSTAIVAGTESKALPLFAPHAPSPDTAGTNVLPCEQNKSVRMCMLSSKAHANST